MGQELTEAEEKMRADLARDAMGRELGAWKQFKGFELLQQGCNSQSVTKSRRALTLDMVDGKKDPKAR